MALGSSCSPVQSSPTRNRNRIESNWFALSAETVVRALLGSFPKWSCLSISAGAADVGALNLLLIAILIVYDLLVSTGSMDTHTYTHIIGHKHAEVLPPTWLSVTSAKPQQTD